MLVQQLTVCYTHFFYPFMTNKQLYSTTYYARLTVCYAKFFYFLIGFVFTDSLLIDVVVLVCKLNIAKKKI